jgi:hypothetical protein
MNKKKYSTMLLWSAALISVVRYAGAFIASDAGSITGWASQVLIVLMGITGIGMGILDSIGSAFLFNGWRISMPKSGYRWPFKFKLLTVFVFGLIIDGLIILIPFTVSRVTGRTMEGIMGLTNVWWWAGAVNLAPYMLLGGIMSGNANMITDDGNYSSESAGKLSVNNGKLSATSAAKQDWRKVRPYLSDQELYTIGYEWTPAQISSHYKLPSDGRCARNWKQYAQNELQMAQQQNP